MIICHYKNKNGMCLVLSNITGKRHHLSDNKCQEVCKPNDTYYGCDKRLRFWRFTGNFVNVKIQQPKELIEIEKYNLLCRPICEKCGECGIVDRLCRAGRYDLKYMCFLQPELWPEPPEVLRESRDFMLGSAVPGD